MVNHYYRLPSMQRIFRVAMAILLLEIVHKLVTLQQLMALQDKSKHIEHLVDLSHPTAPEAAKTTGIRETAAFTPETTKRGVTSSEKARTTGSATTSEACRIPPSEGPEGNMGFQALTKIQIVNNSFSSLRLLCVVVTDSTHHKDTLPAILATYAPKCDGFLALSNVTDPRVSAVEISSVGGDWERLQRIWKFVLEEYIIAQGPFDAFHFGEESTYVIPSNLKRMLLSYPQFRGDDQQQYPMYSGGAVVASRKNPQTRHCGGKAGYTLNLPALRLANRLSGCRFPKDSSLPVDQRLAHCLQELANLQCVKTVDQDSALRYIEFGLDYQAKFSTKNKKYIKWTPIKAKPLAQYHGIYIRDGLQGIATDAVAFSVVDIQRNNIREESGYTIADAIRRVDAILKRTCKSQWDDRHTLALDEHGNPGYIHDVTYLQRHPPSMELYRGSDDFGVCDLPFGRGCEERMGHLGLEKIQIMKSEELPKKRVLCMIYTHSGRHQSRLEAIAETYGPYCDGFFAASNTTDVSIGAVNIIHEGPEAYSNMWLKVRSMWKYAYQHYLQDYDMFHIGGDDHYVIPENLVYMASVGSWRGTWNFSTPLFLGGSMVDFPITNLRYCGGGSGYTLNRAALRLLIEDLFDTYHCRPHYHASDEDRIISECFRSVGIQCMDTNDARNETRYHQDSANFHANWTRDQPAVWHAEPLDRIHGIASKERLGQISESSISFHLKEMPKDCSDGGIRRYHAILHGLCKEDSLIEEGKQL